MICPLCQAENDDDSEACFTCGKPLVLAPTAITRGSVISSRYEVLSPLGKGGMGMVFKAHDRVLDEIVALKTLRSDVAREPDVARRFLAETKLARKIRHKNVCGIHEYKDDGGLRYIAMELVDGIDLRRLLRESGPIPTEEAFDMSIQIARGLEAIHKAGVIHRDLKTPNIMRDSKGVIRLMDFGIAKQSGSETTLGGQVVGTPEYMSPEQARGHKVGFRADIYALGIVIYEIFTGRVPFRGETPIATILKQLHDPPPLDSPEAAAIPRPLVPILRRALEKQPADRFASAKDLLEALEQAREAWRSLAGGGLGSGDAPDASVPSTVAQASASTSTAARLALAEAPTPFRTDSPTWTPSTPVDPLDETLAQSPPSRAAAASAPPRPAWVVAVPAAVITGLVVWLVMRVSGPPVVGPAAPPTPSATMPAPAPSSDSGVPASDSPRSPSSTASLTPESPRAPSPPKAGEHRTGRPSPPTGKPSATAAPTGAATRPASPSPNPTPETASTPQLVVTTPAPAPTAPAVPAPTPRPTPRPVRRGDLVENGPGVKLPRVKQTVVPTYPPTAERFKREARVLVDVLVDETGRVLDVRITQPDPSKLGFNEAAEKAARETSFEPATKDGVAVKIWFPLGFSFKPQER